jgi:ABC-type bacteriocin/lantibiotic exporter with double-glycine peptidase domain
MAKQFYIPDIFQNTDYDCGVECVQAILAFYGVDYTEFQLEKLLKVSRKNGTKIKSIVEFFRRRKYKVKCGQFTFDDLKKFIHRNTPVIILIQAWKDTDTDYELTNSWGHYVIVNGYNKKGFIIEDPAMFGRGFLSYNQLKKRWHGYGDNNKVVYNFGIAVYGKPRYDYKTYRRIL